MRDEQLWLLMRDVVRDRLTSILPLFVFFLVSCVRSRVSKHSMFSREEMAVHVREHRVMTMFGFFSLSPLLQNKAFLGNKQQQTIAIMGVSAQTVLILFLSAQLMQSVLSLSLFHCKRLPGRASKSECVVCRSAAQTGTDADADVQSA